MPIPKVRTGRLAPDQEALDYYDTPVKHWTHTDWDQIDMSKVDVGLHSDPTPGGLQAADRRMYNQLMIGRGDDVTKDMRIHVGNSLHTDDIGHWDIPGYAKDAILDALYNENPLLAAQFEKAFPNTSIASSTIQGDARAVEEMAAMRQWLLDNDIQTIAYTNAEEGLQGAVDAATTNPQWLAFEEEQLGKIQALRMDSARAERNGDMDLSEQINDEANMLEDELEYARDEAVREAEAENISYISLDPGNVRSADAAFQKDMIGKPDMMGSATTPMLGALAGLGATGSVLASQSPSESLSQGWEALKGLGEMVYNDASEASEGVHYGLTGDRMSAPKADWNEETPLGNALAQDIGEYISGIEPIPFSDYTVGQGIEDLAGAYNQYLKPYLSERQEAGLGGGALMASMVGLPGKKNVVTNTVDTRLGKQTPAANTRSMEEQATRVREALAEEGGYETIAEDVVDLQSLPVLSRSDLEGGVFMPTAGDGTMHANLKRSSGIDVDTELQGGPGYGALYDDWESTADIANSYQDKVRQVAEAAGTDKVFGSYNPMRLPSASFSTMPAEVASQQLQTLLGAGARYNPKMVDEINRAVAESGGKKQPNRDFPGILSPDAEAFLSQRGSAPVSARKAMLSEMAKAPYRDAGFPLVEQIYRDVSYPELHNRDIGETGDLILRLDPNAPTRTSDWHRSYGTVIPSKGKAARLAGTAPFSTVYRDAWKQLQGVMTEPKLNKKGEWTTPRLLNKLEKTNTINWNKPGTEGAKTSGFQLIDEQLLDELQRRGLLAD